MLYYVCLFCLLHSMSAACRALCCYLQQINAGEYIVMALNFRISQTSQTAHCWFTQSKRLNIMDVSAVNINRTVTGQLQIFNVNNEYSQWLASMFTWFTHLFIYLVKITKQRTSRHWGPCHTRNKVAQLCRATELPRQLSISCRQTIAKQTWLPLTHMTTQLSAVELC